MLKAKDDLAGALASYQAKRDIDQRLVKADPDNTSWQRDLSVAYDKIGDVLVAQGDLSGALQSYQRRSRDCRAARRQRREQRRMAARPLGHR